MKFIVIEGDNGTGKDTLAQMLANQEKANIVTYDIEAKNAEKVAKRFDGEKKIEMFLGYNKLCSDLVASKKADKQGCILIRYWISTLAAAYADGVYSYETVLDMSKKCMSKLEIPEHIIRLKCNFDERVKRIEQRNSENFDDKTLRRDIRYRYITDKIKTQINTNWIDIDTTGKSREEILKEVINTVQAKDVDFK